MATGQRNLTSLVREFRKVVREILNTKKVEECHNFSKKIFGKRICFVYAAAFFMIKC